MGHYLSTSSSSEDSSQPIPDPSTKKDNNNNITINPQKIDTKDNNIANKNPQEMEAKDNITKNPQEIETNGGPEQEEERVANGDEEEEEEGECGFCLFMKGGGCKDSFVAWEKCIEEAEKNKQDIVDKCFEVTGALKKCMEVHTDYYAPILQAEKAAEAELEREIEKEGSEASSTNVPDSDNVKVVQKD